ncbi:MAG: molecular chaperone [Parashewanella sp.]
MFIGFDYGSANCAVGVMEGNEVKLLSLEADSHYMMSTLYAYDRELISEAVYHELPASQQPEYAKIRSAQLSRARHARHELDLSPHEQAVFVGQQAYDAYLEMPEEGFYVRSPKSFLGATGLNSMQIALFEDIVTLMMQAVIKKAQSQVNEAITHAVIGRPVNFQAIGGEDSNRQAEAILTVAANRAGIEHVSFLFEPLAAGMDYEASLTQDKTVLVVDVGGGTTDCSVVNMSPSKASLSDRKQDCLGHSGQRVGGNDLDIALAMQGFMPEFGLHDTLITGKAVPSQVYWNAVAVNDISAQREFATLATQSLLKNLHKDAAQPHKIARLQKVQQQQLSYQIVKTAEQTKIALSSAQQHSIGLPFIEPELTVSLSQADFNQAVNAPVAKVEALMIQAIEAANVKPDVIYVTGGTAKSPLIYQKIQQVYPDCEVIVGDHFGSVTSGLTRWAHRIYNHS